MGGYPVLLDLTGRRVVVVGGGTVALRRAQALVTAGALVEVIAPRIRLELAALPVDVRQRPYAPGDLTDAWLVHVCTDSPQVNAAVAAEAERRRVPCIRADLAAGGTARTLAVVRAGEVTVAVSAGDDPRRAAGLRNAIGRLLDCGELTVRPHRPARLGRVALVGGGPGDPELITVRGRRLLAEADVLVVDRLAPRALLDTLAQDVEVIDAGKTPHRHGVTQDRSVTQDHMTQDQINAVLVDRALGGARVVRLKGGDPFVFGRGGEELLACAHAGVPVEVVPGVTSAVAGPGAAGIPVTHRGVASDFAVVSAHLDPAHPGSTVDWQALASGPATLVLLMALDRLEQVAAELVKRGRPADTPVAVVRNATLPDQHVLTATLDTVADAVARQRITPPAV
ncbi:MAG: uroporphyrinogen-III C-methyltransferase, partial [Mycobacteriales bacterium]